MTTYETGFYATNWYREVDSDVFFDPDNEFDEEYDKVTGFVGDALKGLSFELLRDSGEVSIASLEEGQQALCVAFLAITESGNDGKLGYIKHALDNNADKYFSRELNRNISQLMTDDLIGLSDLVPPKPEVTLGEIAQHALDQTRKGTNIFRLELDERQPDAEYAKKFVDTVRKLVEESLAGSTVSSHLSQVQLLELIEDAFIFSRAKMMDALRIQRGMDFPGEGVSWMRQILSKDPTEICEYLQTLAAIVNYWEE